MDTRPSWPKGGINFSQMLLPFHTTRGKKTFWAWDCLKRQTSLEKIDGRKSSKRISRLNRRLLNPRRTLQEELYKMYIIFQDGIAGFKMVGMEYGTIEDAIHDITTGPKPNQHFMYFIYRTHSENVPIVGTRFDVYQLVRAVAGSLVTKPHNKCHQYAITHNCSTAWFFTDNLFE